MIKVTLPIFWHTDETKLREDLGIEVEDEYADFTVREIIFYNISGICVYDKKYCKVFITGDEFICALSVKQVEKLIDDAYQKRSSKD